jgi:transposase-like protein
MFHGLYLWRAMAINIECSRCKISYAVGEIFAGQQVKCKNCGNVFVIEAPSADTGVRASAQIAQDAVKARPADDRSAGK